MPLRVALVYGTRPEAIKIAPVALTLSRDDDLRPVLISTGQHRDVPDDIHELFGLRPRHRLQVMRPGQRLSSLTSRIIDELTEIYISHKIDTVIVQGDTSTSFAAAYAAACEQIPVAHLEAGLRTGDRRDPFPEEINRRLITQLSDLHFAPTDHALHNLLTEGVRADDAFVTGNTVIDALNLIRSRQTGLRSELADFVSDHPVVLLTMHRRESWGAPIGRVAAAVVDLCRADPSLRFVVPLHPNPRVKDHFRRTLGSLAQVLLCEPLRYAEFISLVHRSDLVLTDSGGVQEEAPALGTPVLVLREHTERPEGLAAGCSRLVGTDRGLIVHEVTRLLGHPDAYEAMRHPGITCYGDGKAAQRCVEVLRQRWST